MKPRVVHENKHLSQPIVSDRLPPHSLEAEQGLLGCILLDPVKVLAICRNKLKVGEAVFYDLRHQTIYSTILAMTMALDLITVSERLKDLHQLEGVGGLSYLSALLDATPSAANAVYYIQIVMEKWRLRELVQLCSDVNLRAYEGTEDPTKLATELSSKASAIFASTLDQPNMLDLSRKVVDKMNDQREGKMPKGLEIGICGVDRIVRGFDHKFVVVAARASMGKSSFFCTVARNVATLSPQRGHVGIITMESSGEDLVRRMIEIESGLSFRDMHQFRDEDLISIEQAKVRVSKLPILTHYEVDMRIDQVCSIAAAWVGQQPMSCILIENLANISGTKEHKFNRDRYTELAQALWSLSRQLNCPVFVAHHLNRDAEDRRPRLSDISESGKIEDYADLVMLLHQPKSDEKRLRLKTVDCDVMIEKHRGGETNDAHLQFHRYSGWFADPPVNLDLPIL